MIIPLLSFKHKLLRSNYSSWNRELQGKGFYVSPKFYHFWIVQLGLESFLEIFYFVALCLFAHVVDNVSRPFQKFHDLDKICFLASSGSHSW